MVTWTYKKSYLKDMANILVPHLLVKLQLEEHDSARVLISGTYTGSRSLTAPHFTANKSGSWMRHCIIIFFPFQIKFDRGRLLYSISAIRPGCQPFYLQIYLSTNQYIRETFASVSPTHNEIVIDSSSNERSRPDVCRFQTAVVNCCSTDSKRKIIMNKINKRVRQAM